MDKQILRKELAATRKSFAEGEDAELAGICASSRIMASPAFAAAQVVLLYSSLPDEMPTKALIDAVVRSKTASGTYRKVALPVVVGNELVLREYVPGKTVTGYRGIEEPSGECPEISPSEIDLAVIPGVAFTPDGRRLGRGKGYYDRLLPQLRCHKIGLCFECQIVSDIPCDPWDIPVDEVIF